jgi:HEAT repeat protein
MSAAPPPNLLTPPRRALVRRALRWTMPVLLVAVAAGLWQRERLWLWYCAERLQRTDDEHRGEWADKLAAAGEPAVPTLLGLFQHDDPGVSVAAKQGVDRLIAGWPNDDPRRRAFAHAFADAGPRFSTPGRSAALDLLPGIVASSDPEVIEQLKGMIATAAKSESIDLRVQAVAAALTPGLDALDAIVPLISDPEAAVRRAAILALGPVRDGATPALSDDELIRCLHDSDSEVRTLCEMSLRGRGRSARDIQLGRRYTAPDPAERQKLLNDLADEDHLDVTVWLERLTADPDPAVRAGAARVAVERHADLSVRLDQMSRTDPDGTVRRIAAYYRMKLLAMRPER